MGILSPINIAELAKSGKDFTTKSAAASLTVDERIVDFTNSTASDIILVLPHVGEAKGLTYIIRFHVRSSTGNLTVNGVGDEVDTFSAYMDAAGQTLIVISDGLNWHTLVAEGAGRLAIIKAVVDCSTNGTAVTVDGPKLPAGVWLLNIFARASVAFDGDTTTTAEVGITGNIDKYIDATDFDPGTLNNQASMINGTTNDQKIAEYIPAAIQLIVTYTNNANATAGEVEITAMYIVDF